MLDGTMRITLALTILAVLAMAQDKKAPPPPARPGLTITTSAFADGSEIPAKYTQSDPNPISPKLDWTNVPANTASFVLIFHDPDVAIQKKVEDVLHWMVFNIPGTALGLPEDVPAN